jgi:hypothetical protein
MFYFLLGSCLQEFDQYLAIYISSNFQWQFQPQEALLGPSRVLDLEVSTEKTKYNATSDHQNIGLIAYKTLKNLTKFKYLKMNCIREKIKEQIKFGEFHSVENQLSSHLLYNDLKN